MNVDGRSRLTWPCNGRAEEPCALVVWSLCRRLSLDRSKVFECLLYDTNLVI